MTTSSGEAGERRRPPVDLDAGDDALASQQLGNRGTKVARWVAMIRRNSGRSNLGMVITGARCSRPPFISTFMP